jgi:hypothetical protein
MTTLAMIFGMLPLALNLHEGSGQNAPMAHAVIGGLISSTLLTLVVVPVVLTFMDALGRRARGGSRRPPTTHGAPSSPSGPSARWQGARKREGTMDAARIDLPAEGCSWAASGGRAWGPASWRFAGDGSWT